MDVIGNKLQSSHLTTEAQRQRDQQLRCEAHGDEPISIEWFKNKHRLSANELEARYSLHSKANPNRLISILNIKAVQRSDNSIFECVARNQAGKDRMVHELHVQEEPDSIQELQASQIGSRSVTLMWTEPYDGRAPITSYLFQYQRVREVPPEALLGELQFADQPEPRRTPGALVDDWQQAARLVLPVTSGHNQSGGRDSGPGVRSITIERLEPSSRYAVRALAVNSIGSGKFSHPIEFSTDEEAPERGPSEVRALAINSTSIQVSWDEVPRGRHLGRIHGYYIGYRATNDNKNNSSAHNFLYKPYITLNAGQGQGEARLETTLNELKRDTTYDIHVVAFNSRGSGPSSDLVQCKTIEMEPPKPVKIQIRRESNESIFIEWQRDPTDQNPVDDFVLYQEKNSASQEWLQVRLPGNQSQYKAPGLKCGTRYQFYIIAQNKVGKSAPSEVVSASTSGSKPAVPSKVSLIKMLNSSCLLVNLNSFQDSGCRIRTFTVRYRIEKTNLPFSAGSASAQQQHQQQQQLNQPAMLVSTSTGLASSHQALTAALPGAGGSSASVSVASSTVSSGGSSTGGSLGSAAKLGPSDEWITVRPKAGPVVGAGRHLHNPFHGQHSARHSNEEDRLEYLCDLNPLAEYTIHVAAQNDVGRTEVAYSVLMSSDELKHSNLRELMDLLASLPNVFSYIPSILIFLLAGLLLSLVTMVLYTGVVKYYQKFVIIHNQMRATRRAKRDERRRRKLNNLRHSQKLDLWADEYEEEDEDEEGDEEDDDGEDDEHNAGGRRVDEETNNDADCDEISSGSNSGGSCNRFNAARCRAARRRSAYLPAGHYMSNIASSAFDSSSMDTSGCGRKYNESSCGHSTASTESIHGRFQCLNSKQYVKMNEYTMLPSISASLSPAQAESVYGQTVPAQVSQVHQVQQQANPSIYYSTLRRSNMQTYLPQRGQQQQQQRSQNMSDIYGYYVAPSAQIATTCSPVNSQTKQQQHQQDQQHHAANEAANSIFVPPQQIIYSAPNIRRQPVFL